MDWNHVSSGKTSENAITITYDPPKKHGAYVRMVNDKGELFGPKLALTELFVDRSPFDHVEGIFVWTLILRSHPTKTKHRRKICKHRNHPRRIGNRRLVNGGKP